MEKDWVKLFETTNFYKAEMIRQALAEHGIDAVIMNKQDSSYRFGLVELFAHESDREVTQDIIRQMEENEAESGE